MECVSILCQSQGPVSPGTSSDTLREWAGAGVLVSVREALDLCHMALKHASYHGWNLLLSASFCFPWFFKVSVLRMLYLKIHCILLCYVWLHKFMLIPWTQVEIANRKGKTPQKCTQRKTKDVFTLYTIWWGQINKSPSTVTCIQGN